MSKARILVVDDKENMLKLFEKLLGSSYELTTASDGVRAIALLAEREFDVIVTDIRMPGADGFQVLEATKRQCPDTEVILMTAYASVPKAVEAIRAGAYDYVTKPFDPDEALLVISRALERKRLKELASRLRTELIGVYGFQNFVGKSGEMRKVYELLARASELDITVLLQGETGTGKELAARAVHFQSGRRERSFVPVNCGALPSELVESELFGHSKGAFTGAAMAKAGLFEEAEGGTIFLDEIGELPLPVQVKLNRALQEREIRRVGENTPIEIDVRVIAATHRDLRAEVAAGRFREDLFYRLNVYTVRLPPLRERREDIPLLAVHFLTKYATAYSRRVEGFEPDALAALSGYDWPGNVRDLENALERAVAVATGKLITTADLPENVAGARPGALPREVLTKLPYKDVVELGRQKASHDYLVALLRDCKGNVTRAAQQAGMERGSLHRLLKRHGIRSESFKQRD